MSRLHPYSVKGRPRLLHFEEAFDSIVRVVRTGMQWRQLRPPTVSYMTVFKTMYLWIKARAFETAYTRLLRLYRRHRRPKFCCIDSSYVKNIYGRNYTGRNPTDRGRRATKLSVIVDDQGIPQLYRHKQGNRYELYVLLCIVLQPTCQL